MTMYYDDDIFNKHVPESELQRQLMERIAFHTQQAIQLNGFINTCLSVAKLPPEILSEIFLNYASIVRNARIETHSKSKQPDRNIHTTFYEWMRVTHVCKHWREVALNCAHLWTWVAFEERTSFHFIHALIKRSLNLPLTYVHTANPDIVHCASCIDSDSFYEGAFEALSLIKQYLPRIRDLTIFIGLGGEFSDTFWEGMDENPAPILETLRIEATGSARPTVNQHGTLAAHVSLCDRLFNACTPHLQSLTLSGVAFRYTNTIITQGLRYLEIITPLCADLDVDDSTSFRALIAHLPLLPSLETFVLHWWPHLNPLEIHRQQNTTISLPKLRLLNFTGPELASHYLAKCIKPLSPGATLRYSLGRHCALPKATLGHLVSAAGSFLRNSSPHAVSYGTQKPSIVKGLGGKQLLTSAHLWATPTPALSTSDVDARQATQSHCSEPSQCAKRTLAAPPSLILDSIEKKLLAATLQRLDLSRVHTVQIAGFDEGDVWTDALKNAHGVTTLRAVGMAAFGLSAALAAGVSKDIVYGATDRFQVLQLLGASIHQQVHGDRNDGGDEVTAGAWDWTRFWNAKEHESAGDRDDAAGSAATHSPALFPKLQVIQLVDVDFAAAGGSVQVPSMETERVARVSEEVLERFAQKRAVYGFQVGALVKALRVRRAQGASDIVRVELENCACFDMVQLTPLLRAVHEVWWDGKHVDQANGGV